MQEDIQIMQGKVIWLTGLSGAGKSTLGEALFDKLKKEGREVELLDGDVVRTNLSKGLGFSKEDRDTNVKRIAFVANLLARYGVTVIVSAISPYQETRNFIKADRPYFHEVYVKASIETVKERDPKGLYKKVLAGEIKNFTGIDDPYEVPPYPSLVIDTEKESVEESMEKLYYYAKKENYFMPRQYWKPF